VPLREFLHVLRSRWVTIVASILVVVAVSAVLTLRQTPVYQASARFYLAAESNSTQKSANRGNYVVTTADLNTYVAVLGSPSVMEPLRSRLGLAPGTPIDVTASVAGDTSILAVTARSSDPRLAARTANATGPQLAAVAVKFSVLLRSSGQQIRATTISPAVPPSSPTSPDLTRNLLLALLAGLFLGTGLAFARHALDTKVRSEGDIKTFSTSPMLSGLPVERSSGKEGLLLEESPFGGYAEAVRRLRTNLLFVDVTTGSHSFVVTSAVPGEGKTTTAINLAFAMAHSGGRVLLVDGDLRNPSVARRMGLEDSVGLTSVLLGDASLDDVTQRWKESNLFVLGAGQIPPNPSELLGSEPMQELFGTLAEKYDFVLVDSPPLVPVIDAVLLERLTGGMLMVVAWNRTKKRDLSSAVKSLDTVGAHVSGFTFNMVSASNADVYRHGYYRYEGYSTAGESDATAIGGTPGSHADKLKSSSSS
jgi:capsular exopolysaccharide synthesis family protein